MDSGFDRYTSADRVWDAWAFGSDSSHHFVSGYEGIDDLRGLTTPDLDVGAGNGRGFDRQPTATLYFRRWKGGHGEVLWLDEHHRSCFRTWFHPMAIVNQVGSAEFSRLSKRRFSQCLSRSHRPLLYRTVGEILVRRTTHLVRGPRALAR